MILGLDKVLLTICSLGLIFAVGCGPNSKKASSSEQGHSRSFLIEIEMRNMVSVYKKSQGRSKRDIGRYQLESSSATTQVRVTNEQSGQVEAPPAQSATVGASDINGRMDIILDLNQTRGQMIDVVYDVDTILKENGLSLKYTYPVEFSLTKDSRAGGPESGGQFEGDLSNGRILHFEITADGEKAARKYALTMMSKLLDQIKAQFGDSKVNLLEIDSSPVGLTLTSDSLKSFQSLINVRARLTMKD